MMQQRSLRHDRGALPKLWALGGGRRLLLWMLLLVLPACASHKPAKPVAQAPAPSAPASRYEMEHDSPVLEDFDLTRVRPVQPVAEPRTLAGNMSPYTVNGQTYRVMDSERDYVETGMASWYGRKFHGHKTSNGEVYDMFQLSAAHRSLPIPSYLNVTNLENGRSVVVRVNDRGPFHSERIVDLSYAAAAILGYADKGTARVRLEALVPDQSIPPRYVASNTTVARAPGVADEGVDHFLQVGAFSSRAAAEAVVRRLGRITALPASIHGQGEDLHRVRLGPLGEDVDMTHLVQAIMDAGLGTPFRVSP